MKLIKVGKIFMKVLNVKIEIIYLNATCKFFLSIFKEWNFLFNIIVWKLVLFKLNLHYWGYKKIELLNEKWNILYKGNVFI